MNTWLRNRRFITSEHLDSAYAEFCPKLVWKWIGLVGIIGAPFILNLTQHLRIDFYREHISPIVTDFVETALIYVGLVMLYNEQLDSVWCVWCSKSILGGTLLITITVSLSRSLMSSIYYLFDRKPTSSHPQLQGTSNPIFTVCCGQECTFLATSAMHLLELCLRVVLRRTIFTAYGNILP